MNTLMLRVESWERGESELAPVTALLGIRPVRWSEGAARLEMPADERHHNAMGTVHGGIFCDLADVAIGVAMASTLAEGEGFTSLSMSMSYLRPMARGRLVAEAKLLRRGRETAYLECEILDETAKLLAKASSTCLIRILPPAR